METSNTIGPKIAEAIGLPTKGLRGFSLHFEAQQFVQCRAEYYVLDGAEMQMVLKSYVLTPVDEAQ